MSLLRDERGFTLAEVLVAMVMMLTVMFALYSIFDMSLRVFSFGNDKIEAVENARLGLERMEREIRAAQPQRDDSGDEYLLDTWTDDTIKFEHQGTNGPEQITYSVYQTGSTYALGRAEGSESNEPVVEYVEDVNDDGQALTFRYFEDDSNTEVMPGTGDESDVTLVQVTLEIAVEDGSQSLTTYVNLRNRSGDE